MTGDECERPDVSSSVPFRLGEVARARSGDKGTGANIGVFVESERDYSLLLDQLTADRVLGFFEPMGAVSATRFELPNLLAFNFVLRGILSQGTRVDAQGKALGQAILEMPIHVPSDMRLNHE